MGQKDKKGKDKDAVKKDGASTAASWKSGFCIAMMAGFFALVVVAASALSGDGGQYLADGAVDLSDPVAAEAASPARGLQDKQPAAKIVCEDLPPVLLTSSLDLSRPVEVANWTSPAALLEIGLERLGIDPEFFPWPRVFLDAVELSLQKCPTNVAAGSLMVLVPRDAPFQWPAIRLGYTHKLRLTKYHEVTLVTRSLKPRVFDVQGFLQEGEASRLIYNSLHQRAPVMRMARSGTGTESRKAGYVDEYSEGNVRTSDNAYDTSSPLAHRFFRRSFAIAGHPYMSDRADGVQVVRYRKNMAYGMHPDGFPDIPDFHHDITTGGSNRLATVFVYVNASQDLVGGHTYFPYATKSKPLKPQNGEVKPAADQLGEAEAHAEINGLPQKWARQLSTDCENAARGQGSGLSVPPVPGNAVLFYDVDPFGRHIATEHAACPVLRGEKWGSNLWVWARERYVQRSMADTRRDLVMVFITTQDPKNAAVYWTAKGVRRKMGTLERGRNTIQLWHGVKIEGFKDGMLAFEEVLKGKKKVTFSL
jgi:prolyl 4-hydroxylase